MRTIGAWTHGILDYLVVILLVIGPSVAGFVGRQAMLAYVLAVLLFALTIFTRFPLGVIKVVRFPLHGAVEAILAGLLVILPWLANFSKGIKSRNFYVAIGFLMILIWVMTDFRGMRGQGATIEPDV